MIVIRDEEPRDHSRVFELNKLAFDGYEEANIIERLRSVPGTISMVAEQGDMIVGHICLSPVTLNNEIGSFAGLAPMSVLPGFQRQGIGSRLVEAGLERCREKEITAIFVLGHPEYYPRFGFTPASDLGITCEYDVPPEYFMALELVPGALIDSHGMVKYHPVFSGS
jgi:putative acetyltransferase